MPMTDFGITDCQECGETFKKTTKRNTICPKKECKASAQRRRYRTFDERHPGRINKMARERKKRLNYTPWPAKRALGLEIATLKATTPCTDCGNTFPEECMDFDHIADDKSNNVGTMVAHGHNRDMVMAEIAKCELVCSNCHRTRTKTRRLEKRAAREAADRAAEALYQAEAA